MCLGLANGGKQPAEMTVQEAIKELKVEYLGDSEPVKKQNK